MQTEPMPRADANTSLAGCLVAVRYADIRYLGGRTAEGVPATMAHWRRYVLVLMVASTAVWLTAHIIPGFGL